jgi:hypothetical protein
LHLLFPSFNFCYILLQHLDMSHCMLPFCWPVQEVILFIFIGTHEIKGVFLGYAMYSIPEIQEESINRFLPQCNELLNFSVVT